MASTSSPIIPGLDVSLEDLETYVSHARQGQYLLVAGITLVLYDYFCTLAEEISFVWAQAPYFVAAKILFALNRYLPIITIVIRFLLFEKALYNQINVAIVEVVLLLRVWVLYARKKWVGIALWSFYVVCLGLALAVKFLQPHTGLPFVTPPAYGNTGCSRVVPEEMFFKYGVVTVIESVFFIMLLYKAFQSTHTPVLTALLKQGTFYYFLVLAILTITMFAPFSDVLYWPIANAIPIVPIVSIACNRLILSLRGMVFSQNAVRASGFGMSGSGLHDHAGSGTGSGNYQIRLPSTKYIHSPRDIHPIGDTRKIPALNADRPTTAVTFSNEWKDQNHHQLGDSPVTLDAQPVYDRRRQSGGGSGTEESWSAMEGGEKRTSMHPMVPIRRG